MERFVHYTRWGKAFLSPCGVCPGSTVHIVTASVCGARGSVRTCSLMCIPSASVFTQRFSDATPQRCIHYGIDRNNTERQVGKKKSLLCVGRDNKKNFLFFASQQTQQQPINLVYTMRKFVFFFFCILIARCLKCTYTLCVYMLQWCYCSFKRVCFSFG